MKNINELDGFRDRLRSKMREKEMRQKDLCKRIKISESALSNYMNNRIPESIAIMARIAQELGVSLDYLVLGKSGSLNDEILYPTRQLLANHSIQMEQRIERQNALFARCTQVINDSLRDVATEIADSYDKLSDSILTENDVWDIEQCSTLCKVASPVMVDEFVFNNDSLSSGPYIDKVAENLKRNKKIRYHFWVNADAGLPSDIEARARVFLSEHYGCLSTDRIRITRTKIPMCTQIAVYTINTKILQRKRVLWERTKNHISSTNRLGVVLSPTQLAQVDLMMDETHLGYTNSYLKLLENNRIT